MMIYVEGVSDEVQTRIQNYVESKIIEEANKYQKSLELIKRNKLNYSPAQLRRINRLADEYDVHPGRIILIIEILDADDQYTVQELSRLPVRELHEIFKTLYPNNE